MFTTMGGSFSFDSSSGKMKATLNVAFRLIFASIALIYSIQCFKKFHKREIGTRVNFVPAGEFTNFPSLTLCWRVGYKKNVLRDDFDYDKYNQITDDGDFPANVTMVEFMNRSRLTLAEYLEAMTVETFSKVRGSYHHVLYNNPDLNVHDRKTSLGPTFAESVDLIKWNLSVATKDNGLCYTADIPEEFTSVGISGLAFKFYSNSEFRMMQGRYPNQHGWNLYLHQKGNFRSSNTLAVQAPDGSFVTRATVSFSMFIQMSDSEKCSKEMITGYDDCWNEHVNARIKETAGCLFPWNIPNLSEDDEDILCKDSSLYSGNTEDNARAEMRDRQVSHCKTPCEVMSFDLASHSSVRITDPSTGSLSRQYGILYVDFMDTVTTTKEYYVYDAVSMVGEAGGYLGLFLGISCYQIVMMCSEWFIQRKEKKRSIQDSQQQEKCSKY